MTRLQSKWSKNFTKAAPNFPSLCNCKSFIWARNDTQFATALACFPLSKLLFLSIYPLNCSNIQWQYFMQGMSNSKNAFWFTDSIFHMALFFSCNRPSTDLYIRKHYRTKIVEFECKMHRFPYQANMAEYLYLLDSTSELTTTSARILLRDDRWSGSKIVIYIIQWN